MFERKTEFNKQIELYKNDIAEMEKNRQMKEIQLQNMQNNKEQLSKEMNSIKEEKRQLSMQYKSKLDELKKMKDIVTKQTEETRNLIKNRRKMLEEKVCGDPVLSLLYSYLGDFAGGQKEENEEDQREFKEYCNIVERIILQNCAIPYNHKQYLREQEELLNLNNSIRGIQQPFEEMNEEFSKVLNGKLPADIHTVEQYEIKKKVVQIQMLIDIVNEIKIYGKLFFNTYFSSSDINRLELLISYGISLKRNIINMCKVFSTFLEDEQLLMVSSGDDIVSNMQEIGNINSDLCSCLQKIIKVIETINVGYKTTIYGVYSMKDLK